MPRADVVFRNEDGSYSSWDGQVKNLVYDSGTLSWVAQTPSSAVTVSGNVSTVEQTGIINFAFDYVSLSVATTTDTYVFKTGGSGGTTVATVVITYTDSSKTVLSNVVKS